MPLLPLLLAAATLPGGADDVLAPARAGMLQCYEPDVATRTCRSTAAYRQVDRQRYINTALVLLSPESAVTLETETTVTIRNGAVCGAITLDSLAAGKLRAAGKLLSHEQSRSTLEKIERAMAPLIGKEICTTYVRSGDAFVARATMNGAPMPGDSQRVMWISPRDGFAVAPKQEKERDQ